MVSSAVSEISSAFGPLIVSHVGFSPVLLSVNNTSRDNSNPGIFALPSFMIALQRCRARRIRTHDLVAIAGLPGLALLLCSPVGAWFAGLLLWDRRGCALLRVPSLGGPLVSEWSW